MKTKTSILVLLSAFALAAPAFAAAPEAKEEGDKLVLRNDHVTVWFQGKKPMLKVFPTANATPDGNATGGYSYKFSDVVEYRDLDGNGAPSNNEIVASLNLDKASAWNVNRTTGANGSVVLNLTLKGPVKMGPKADQVPPIPGDVNVSLPDRDADVGLVFTLHEGASTVQAGMANLTVPATSVKYDFVVNRWPFVDASATRLALVLQVEGALELANASGVEGATVTANGTSVGALAWTPTALGQTAAGAVEFPVKTVAAAEGNMTRLVHTYDAPGLTSLVHDPTIGVMPTEDAMQPSGAQDDEEGTNKVPAPAFLALAGVAAVVALLRRR